MSFLRRVGHVLAKDVRRFAVPLMGIAALALLRITGLLPQDDPVGRLGHLIPVGVFPVVLAIFAVLVVHEDHPSIDRASWSTHPVGGGAVAVAKVLFLSLLLCALPVAVQTLWFAALDPGAPLPAMSRDSLVYVGGVLGLAAAGAAVTRSLRSFLAMVLAVWVVELLLDAVVPSSWWVRSLGYRRGGSVSFALQSGWLLVGLVLLVHQYLTRRVRRTLLLGVAGLVAIPVLGSRLASTPTAPNPPPRPAAPAREVDTGGLEVVLEQLLAETWRPYFSRGLEGVSGRFTGRESEGRSLLLTEVRSRLTGPSWEHDFHFDSEPVHAFRGGDPPRYPHLPGLRPARARFGGVTSGFSFLAPLAEGTPEELRALGDAEELEVELTWTAFEWGEVARARIGPRAIIDLASGDLLTFDVVRRHPRALMLHVIHRWTPEGTSIPAGGTKELQEEYLFVLHSRTYGEYMTAQINALSYASRTLVGGSSLREVSAQLVFQAVMVDGGQGELLPEDWFEDVELIVLERTPVGSVTRPFAWKLDDWPGPGETIGVGQAGAGPPAGADGRDGPP